MGVQKYDWGSFSDEDLLRLIRQHGSMTRAATALGIPRSTFSDEMRRRGLATDLPPPGQTTAKKIPVENGPDIRSKVYDILRAKTQQDGISIYDIADALDVAPQRVRNALAVLERSGKSIHRAGDMVSAYVLPGVEHRVRVDVGGASRFKVGIVSDTHFGSKMQQPSALRAYMERATDEHEPVCWLHVGDLTDGFGVYRGQANEVWLTGADEQAEYAASAYPDTGCPTKIIGGNHDESFLKSSGSDVIRRFAALRQDVEPVGWRGAYVDVGGVSFYLWHGSGGVAYARSYRLQKRIESFGDSDKPHILLAGHWHQYCHVWHRGVHGFLVPSFQGTTLYIRSLGYESLVGGMVLEVVLDDEGEPAVIVPHVTRIRDVPVSDYPKP